MNQSDHNLLVIIEAKSSQLLIFVLLTGYTTVNHIVPHLPSTYASTKICPLPPVALPWESPALAIAHFAASRVAVGFVSRRTVDPGGKSS